MSLKDICRRENVNYTKLHYMFKKGVPIRNAVLALRRDDLCYVLREGEALPKVTKAEKTAVGNGSIPASKEDRRLWRCISRCGAGMYRGQLPSDYDGSLDEKVNWGVKRPKSSYSPTAP